MDLPSRRIDQPVLPIDRTIDSLFIERLQKDRQAAATAFREREERLRFPSRRFQKVSNSI